MLVNAELVLEITRADLRDNEALRIHCGHLFPGRAKHFFHKMKQSNTQQIHRTEDTCQQCCEERRRRGSTAESVQPTYQKGTGKGLAEHHLYVEDTQYVLAPAV